MDREKVINAKNRCSASILTCLEEKTNLNELDFYARNEVRNLVRYELVRLINVCLLEMGFEEKVKMSRRANR